MKLLLFYAAAENRPHKHIINYKQKSTQTAYGNSPEVIFCASFRGVDKLRYGIMCNAGAKGTPQRGYMHDNMCVRMNVGSTPVEFLRKHLGQ